MDIVTADIGGTNARFAIARIAGTKVVELGEPVTLHTASHATLATAWAEFAKRLGRTLPSYASLAVATPITGDVLKMTNNPWVLRPATLANELGLDRVMLVNDFGAVGHAIGAVEPAQLRHITGPDLPLPDNGVVAVLGPGTGLGVAHVVRRNGRSEVIESEGGHLDFAPLDPIEDVMLSRLRAQYRRVSAERIVSGPGLVNIYDTLAALEGGETRPRDDATLWQAALDGTDALAAAALQRFCQSLGSVAGDIALVTGAQFVVIGGGLGARLVDILPQTGFAARFVAKGRMEPILAAMPVKVITHPQPGLLGAAAAFAARQERPKAGVLRHRRANM